MKNKVHFIYVVLSSLFILFLSCLKIDSNISNQNLKVMTFNIRYGTAPDGDNVWANRKDILFDVIQNCKPDILGVQEALYFQLIELNEKFLCYKKSGVGRDDGINKGEHTTIF